MLGSNLEVLSAQKVVLSTVFPINLIKHFPIKIYYNLLQVLRFNHYPNLVEYGMMKYHNRLVRDVSLNIFRIFMNLFTKCQVTQCDVVDYIHMTLVQFFLMRFTIHHFIIKSTNITENPTLLPHHEFRILKQS